MKRSLGVRYLPLAGLVAIQLLIVAVAPSVQEKQAVSTNVGGFDPDGFDPTAGSGFDSGPVFTDPDTGVAVGSSTDGAGDSASGVTSGGTFSGGTTAGGAGSDATGGTTGGTTAGASGPTGGSGPATTPAPGASAPGGGQTAQRNTAHCVGDRQFDPAIEFYAPPCVPKSNGTNPGASYQGVSGEEILLIRYYARGHPALDAVDRSQDVFVTPTQHETYLDAVADFINANYELYGRKVRFEVFEGSCDTIPPDESCLQNEFRELIESKKPFAVQWNTSLCSSCFAEMSKVRTVNIGGWNFRDEFGQRWRPYHYDTTMSGTRIAQHAARFWCKQLQGGKAQFSRNYQNTVRALGVIATNDPENQNAIEIDLKNELRKCDASFDNRTYFYEQDIATADTQRRAGVLAMRGNAIDPADDATSVMCFCDRVAPAFLYQEEDTQQYYPENIVIGSGFMDSDASAQSYIGAVGCPQGSPCAFDGAFGFRSIGIVAPKFQGPGSRVWQASGRDGDPPFLSVDIEWDYWNMLASGMQMAGPNLNPETLEQGMFRLGARGDSSHPLRQFSPGNYNWIQDADRVYWSSTKPSPYNGEIGTYVRLDQGRLALNDWPASPLALPPMPR